ncbi:MAG: response regulator FixJ [Rhizomicrobium sp.]
MSTDPAVFVVDDDDAVRESLEFSLKLAGHHVESFSSAATFLASGASSRPGCLITDIRMPEMDGIELQEELKKRGSVLPVIVITGHGDVPLAVRAMKAGAGDFLEKPFARDALLAAVERALEKHMRTIDAGAESAGIRKRIALLTPREREVFDRVVAGKQSKVIAHELGSSPRTVEIQRARMMKKLEATSLQDLVRMAITAGVHT